MKKLPLSVAALLMASTALSCVSARAEDKTVLSTVTVTAEAESLTAPSSAATREELQRIPGGVALVEAETFQNTRAATIKDMLDYTPGVFAQSRTNEESRLSIRGSGLSRTFHLRGLNLYQDNIPINLSDGSADFQDIDPLAFRHVEVYKGANALQLGAATLGGAINFVTPTGYDADRFTARIDGGSFGTRRAQLSSRQVVGDSDYFVSVSKLQSDGFRDFSEQDNTRFFSNFGHKLSDALETRFYFTYGDINQELPGTLTKAQLQADPKQAAFFNRANNWQRDFDVFRIANKTTWQGENVEVNGGVYTLQKDLYHPIFQLIEQQNHDYGIFADSTFSGSVAGKRNELLVGTNLSLGDTNSTRFINVNGNRGAMTANGDEDAKNAVFYAENRFYPTDTLALIAGSQFLYADRDFSDRLLTNGDQSGTKDYHGVSPKIGALWHIRPDVQLFANASTAYEPPTFSDLEQQLPGVTGFADLEAQKSTTLEVGSRGKWRQVEWDVSLYRAWLRDELMMFATGPGTSGVLNADETIHQGIEIGAGASLAENLFSPEDGLSARLAYTYNDFRFDSDPQWGDNRIPGAPEHYVRAELRYDHASGWYVAPNLEAVPDSYPVDMANSLSSDAYALLGVQAGIDITEQVAFFIDARNLTDETYAATTNVITAPSATNQALFYPGDGRAVYAGLTYKW